MPERRAVQAYVLHRYPYQESSLLVELFSTEQGRIGAIARGARRPRSEFARLQPWQLYLVDWRGRGDLATLIQAEENGPFLHLNPLATLCGFYMNELVLRLLTRWDPHPDLFFAYQTGLGDLAGAAPADWVLRRFELALLQAIGFGPDLEHCRQCGARISSETDTWYYAPKEGMFCPRHGDARIHVPASGRAFLQLLGDDGLPSEAERRMLKRWLRQELAVLLGTKPLQSQDLLKAYWRQHGQSRTTA